MEKKIVIIGAGVGGITAATLLVKSGYHVTILEKNTYLGGRCSLIETEKSRFDQGPSIYLMNQIYDEVYNAIDENFSQRLNVMKCEPMYVIFDDDDRIKISSDDDSLNSMLKLKQQIER